MIQMGTADLRRTVDMELELDARFDHHEEDLSWLDDAIDDYFESQEDM